MRTREEIQARIEWLRAERLTVEDGLDLMLISREISALEWVLRGEEV